MAEPVVIWGAGAIGGTIGAHLIRAGHDVLFVDVAEDHVARMAAAGLTIEGLIAAFTVAARAVLPGQFTGTHRCILLAVKAHHTEAATRMLAPHLAADGMAVSCQNGLNELVIAGIVGARRTIGAFVNFSGDWMGPGVIAYAGRGAVVVGELDGAVTARLQALHRLLQDFEPQAQLTDNIFGYLWGKIAYGAVLAASALTDETMADFIANPRMRPSIVAVVREIMQVAVAEGVRPVGFHGFEPLPFLHGDLDGIEASIAANLEFRKRSAKLRSGFWRDLSVRRRPTDAGAQIAPVQAAARRHGIAMPVCDALVTLIADIEQGRRGIGAVAAEELLRIARAAQQTVSPELAGPGHA
jgi:2-dehydropantoate 2-reductase